MSEENTVENASDKNVSLIEQRLLAVQARKAAKAAEAQASGEKPAKVKKEKAPKVIDESAGVAKAAAREAKKAELAEQRAQKKAERQQKKAARLANKGPAHMAKVEKAASRLPSLNESANLLLEEATRNLNSTQVLALAAHLQHSVRVAATSAATNSGRVQVGAKVKMIGGDPRFLGMTGVVSKSQRIRCYVALEGREKPVYTFTSDVQPLE